MEKDKKTGLYYRPETFDLSVIREVYGKSYKLLFENAKGKKVLDLGGNVGAFAKAVSEYGAEFVYSFEPDPENAKLFRKQDIPNCKLYEYAVADKSGTADFYLNVGTNKGMHSLQRRRGRECIQVKTVAFEKVLNKIKPDIIKMDIEGGEYYLDFDLVPDCVELLAIELHTKDKASRENSVKLVEYLRKRYKELMCTNSTEKSWAFTFIGVKR